MDITRWRKLLQQEWEGYNAPENDGSGNFSFAELIIENEASRIFNQLILRGFEMHEAQARSEAVAQQLYDLADEIRNLPLQHTTADYSSNSV